MIAVSAPARAADVDSEHLFGFSEGADIGKKGEREVESEAVARAGKAAGSYGTLTENLEAKFVPVENLRLGGRATFAYFGISGVPGLEDRHQGALQGVSFEARYALIDRSRGPFGLTVIAEPRWGRVDDISGAPVRSYSGMLTVAADKALIADRLFAAFNILYDSDATHFELTDLCQHQSRIGFAAAMAGRVQPGLFLGGEVRYVRVYDGLGLNTYSSQALFAGPTFYLQLSRQLAMSGAWNWQIRGHTAAGGGSLDLIHFERQQAKVRVNFNF